VGFNGDDPIVVLGGNGGNATASACATGTEANPNASASAYATGGVGGFAYLGQGGNGGTATATADVHSDFGGDVSASATVWGGSLGEDQSWSYIGDTRFFYPGLTRAANLITDPSQGDYAVTGYSTGGSVTLSENAFGGSGSINVLPTYGIEGAGSDGNAILITSATHGEISFSVNTSGEGGAGTSGGGGADTQNQGNGYSGGNGVGTSNLTGSGATNLYLSATAAGGSGGWGQGGIPGNGGTATATSTGQSSGNGYVQAFSNANGGTGGANSDDGDPEGGIGGPGGSGGEATSNATASSASGNVEANASATGGIGNGGCGAGTGATSGNGGAATAVATATGTNAIASALAIGGYSASPQDGAVYGSGGIATASSTANGVTVVEVGEPGANGTNGVAQDAVAAGPGGATISFAAYNQNNGSATITGSNAVILGITGSGSLTIGDGTHATTLQLGTSSGGSSVGSLTINADSTLDLANNHLFINYGSGPDPIASIVAWIASGYAGGTWSGTGITSSSAKADSHVYGIGYADSTGSNPAGLSSGQIEIMYTLLGDANLDGKVNGTDFTILATNFNQSVTDGWDKGDFNYDGKVNGSDFLALATNFNQSAGQSAVAGSDLAALHSFADANGISLTSVPEPASATILVMAGLGILRRRRRSSCQSDSRN
jgi:hypothetical protein